MNKAKYKQKQIHITIMKKTLLFGAAVCAVFAMSSCKSNEKAYKKAFEKAQPKTEVQTPVATTPVQTVTPVQNTTVQAAPAVDYSNVSVRTEAVDLVSGAPLKAYSVVVGSFALQSNATDLAAKLSSKGYSPRIVKANTTNGIMYRLVATSYDTKAEAAQSRASLLGQYVGAWLLYQK